MRRRRWLAVAVLVVLAVITVRAVWPTGPCPCRATFEQVREGMTLEEVAATVGGPPGRYSDGYEPFVSTGGRYPYAVYWVAHDAILIVWYDSDRVATSLRITDPMPDDRSWVRRRRDRLGI